MGILKDKKDMLLTQHKNNHTHIIIIIIIIIKKNLPRTHSLEELKP